MEPYTAAESRSWIDRVFEPRSFASAGTVYEAVLLHPHVHFKYDQVVPVESLCLTADGRFFLQITRKAAGKKRGAGRRQMCVRGRGHVVKVSEEVTADVATWTVQLHGTFFVSTDGTCEASFAGAASSILQAAIGAGPLPRKPAAKLVLHDASMDYSLSVPKRDASALTRQEEWPAALAPYFRALCEQALDDEYCDWSFGQDREWSDPLFPLPLNEEGEQERVGEGEESQTPTSKAAASKAAASKGAASKGAATKAATSKGAAAAKSKAGGPKAAVRGGGRASA